MSKHGAYVWYNGELVPWAEANVHVSVHALHYGSSVFEGARAYDLDGKPAIFCLEAHTKRLFNSCKVFRMEIPYTPEVINAATVETVRRSGLTACYIRPLVFRGSGTIALDGRENPVETVIFTLEMGRYLGPEALEQGVGVGVSSWGRMAPNTFPAAAKVGGQYVNSQLIVMEAHDHGYHEGIALDAGGCVSEGSGENLFVVRDGVVLTPPLACSVLEGITRRCVITLAEELGIPVQESRIPRELLYMADEVFFTGTAAEVTPIRSVDGIPVGAGRRGPITEALQQAFFGIVDGSRPDAHGWLTLVE
jgi:branched-chain amino acid aminotransferase